MKSLFSLAALMLLAIGANAQTVCAPPAQASNFSGSYTIAAGTTLPVLWTPSPTAGCTTYFTVNGSTPTSSSPVYTGQTIALTQTTTILMVAEGSGMTTSQQVGGDWTITVTGTAPPVTPLPALFCATSTNPACGAALNWTAPASSTDPVVGYQVFRNGAQLTTAVVTGVTYTDKAIAPSTTYTYYVVSVDAAGAQSTASNSVSVVVPAPPVETPAPPTGLTGTVVD